MAAGRKDHQNIRSLPSRFGYERGGQSASKSKCGENLSSCSARVVGHGGPSGPHNQNNSPPDTFRPASASAKRRGHKRHVHRVGWRRTKCVQTTSQISAAARRGENRRAGILPSARQLWFFLRRGKSRSARGQNHRPETRRRRRRGHRGQCRSRERRPFRVSNRDAPRENPPNRATARLFPRSFRLV